jgi:hypothetical protein
MRMAMRFEPYSSWVIYITCTLPTLFCSVQRDQHDHLVGAKHTCNRRLDLDLFPSLMLLPWELNVEHPYDAGCVAKSNNETKVILR